jgi:hypothetical protein
MQDLAQPQSHEFCSAQNSRAFDMLSTQKQKIMDCISIRVMLAQMAQQSDFAGRRKDCHKSEVQEEHGPIARLLVERKRQNGESATM